MQVQAENIFPNRTPSSWHQKMLAALECPLYECFSLVHGRGGCQARKVGKLACHQHQQTLPPWQNTTDILP